MTDHTESRLWKAVQNILRLGNQSCGDYHENKAALKELEQAMLVDAGSDLRVKNDALLAVMKQVHEAHQRTLREHSQEAHYGMDLAWDALAAALKGT